MKEGQVFPGSKRSKDSKSSAAGDDDQGTESDEGSSVDPNPVPSNPSFSSVTLHFDSESDHLNASLSGFEANEFETPTPLTLKQNQPKKTTSPAQAHLNVTSPTPEPQISQSADVIRSSSEITVSERLDNLPPDATALTTFENLPDLVTQQENTGFDVAEAKNQPRAEEKEADIVASASFSRTEKTGNESAHVAELDQVSNSIGDVSDLEKFDAILLKIREPKGTPLEVVHELEKNAKHVEEESEKFNTRPTTRELNETIETRSIKLSNSVQRVITELGETDDLLHEASELAKHAKQAEDVRVVERVEFELSEVIELDNRLAVDSISEEVKYFGHMDSQNLARKSDQADFLHSEVPAVDVDLQILTDTTKEFITDRLPDNSNDSFLLQDSTDGPEDISLKRDVQLSSTSPSSPFTLSDLDGSDGAGACTVEETVQTEAFSKADVADEDVVYDHSSRMGFREEKNEPWGVKLSGNFFNEMQNREENPGLHSSADKDSFIVEEKSSVSVRESSFKKEKQPKNKSNNELDRKDATEDYDSTDSRTQGKSLFEKDTREKETKEVIIGKNVCGDSQRRKPAVEKDPKEELSHEEKGKEQNVEIDQNEDSLEAEEKIQTAEKDLNEGDYEEEEGEKGQIEEEDFYKDHFVDDQDDHTIEKDLTEDSSNEEEECETEEDVSATEEDSLEFKEEEEEEPTVEEELSEVEGDSLEFKDHGEETGEEELTEDNSQENEGIRERMKVENDFSTEDFQEADSLEKEDDAQTAEEPTVEEELSEVEGDSLEFKDHGEETGEEELTEDNSQENEGIRERMKVENDFSTEDFQEADSLEKEDDAQTAEELSVSEEDSLEPRKDDESSIGDEELAEEDSLVREEDEETVEELSATEKHEEMEEEDETEKIDLAEEDSHIPDRVKQSKILEEDLNRAGAEDQQKKEQTEDIYLTKELRLGGEEVERTGGVGNTGIIEKDETTQSQQGREITRDVEKDLNQEEERADRKDFIEPPWNTFPLPKATEVEVEMPMINEHMQSRITGGTAGETTGGSTGMTIGVTSGMTTGGTAGVTTGGTTKMMETLIAEEEIEMTSDEEIRIFEEEERRIIEEERKLVLMQDAQMAAGEKTEEHEKGKTGMFEQNKTGFGSDEEVSTIEKQGTEQSELKQALTADGQERETANDWKETSEKEKRRISLENERTDINKIRTSERGQVGIQNEEQQTNEEFGQRIKPKEMESNQQMLDLNCDTGTSGYGKREASDKDAMTEVGTGMTENKKREITEERKPVEEQQTRAKEDEEMVEQEKTTAERDSEEQRTRTKEDEEKVEQEKTIPEKDSAEQQTRTKEDEEMVEQEKTIPEKDSEEQQTRTKEDEEKVEQEKTIPEKDSEEQRTRTKEEEEKVEQEKTIPEKDSEEQQTRTKEDEEKVEQEKTTAEKDSAEQQTKTKEDEEMVEQEKTTAEKDLKEQRIRTEEDEEMVQEEKTIPEKDSEEQQTRTKEDEEMVELERTPAEKDSEEQRTRTKEDEEMVEQEKTTDEKDLEEQKTRTKEDEAAVEEERATAEKDLEEQRTRTKEDESMIEQKKTTAEKDLEEQQTRTKEDDEILEQEKTNAEKDSEEQQARTKEVEEMVEQKRKTAEKDLEEQRTKTEEDEEMVAQEKTTDEKDLEEQTTKTEEDEEMVAQAKTTDEKDLEEQTTKTEEDEEMVAQAKTTDEKDLEEQRTRTKEDEEMVAQEKTTDEKDLEEQITRTKEDEEVVKQERTIPEKVSEEQRTRTKEDDEILEQEKTTDEKDLEEQRTKTEEDEEMVAQEKTTDEKDLEEQRTRTKEDEEVVKQERTIPEKVSEEQRTRTKKDDEILEQEKTTAEKDSEEQQIRTKEDEEMVEQEKTSAEKDSEEQRTRTKQDEEAVEEKGTISEKDSEEQQTRTKEDEEMVELERTPAEKASEEQRTRTKEDEEIVEQEKVTAKKDLEEQRTGTKEAEEVAEQEKTTDKQDSEEQRTKVGEEMIEQEKTAAEKDSEVQQARTKEVEEVVEEERTIPEKDSEEQRTRTKEDEEIVEQEKPTAEKELEEQRTRTKEDDEIIEQEKTTAEKDLEEQRTRTKEDEEMVEQEKATAEKDLEEQRTRTKQDEEMVEQEETTGEKDLGEEYSLEEGTVTTENVEIQRKMNDMEKIGLMTEKDKRGKTDQWEIFARTKHEKTEDGEKQKSGVVLEETRVTEKETPGVNVEGKTDVTEHEEIGTQEKEAVGKIKTDAADKTGNNEGEVIVEQSMYKAEEEETEINEEAEVSQNKERGTSDDEEMETPKKDVTGASGRNETRISNGEDTGIIEEKVEIMIEERNAEESIKMSKENKSEINGVDKNGLGSGFEISEKTGMPSITAYGADNIGECNDEILCDGTHEIKEKELKNSAEMAVTSHCGKEMPRDENKTKAAMVTGDTSMTSLNETELTTGSQMGISDDEENYIQSDHRMKVEDREETEKKPQKINSYVDDNFVDDVLEPGFAFSIMSSDSDLSTDDETLLGEKDWTTGQLCRMPAQSHQKRHESYDEEDEDPVWSGYEPVVLFSDESLQSASRSTPHFLSDGLYFEKLSPIMKSAAPKHASSNQFPLQRDQISQSEISNDSMIKQNHDASKRDLNLPQKSFASSVENGQIGSKFGASKEAKQTSETQSNLPFPVGSSWLPPTTAAEQFKKGAEIKKNLLTFGKSSRWTNDSSQFAHPDQQVTLEDSYRVPNGMALGGTTRESKTLHEDFGSMSGKSWQTRRNSVDSRTNGIMSNSASGRVNDSVSYSASGGLNGKGVGNSDSGRYHGSVNDSVGVGLLMCQSCTAQRLNGSSDGTLKELGDVWSRLRGSHAEDCEGKMSHLEEMIHPLECNHQTATTPTSLSCFISPLSKQQELQRPSGTAYRFMGKGTFMKSSRDDMATFRVHDYLEGDDLWKAEKARIFKGLNLRPTKFNSDYLTARNASPKSVEDQQPSSSLSALVDNMKSINSRLRKEADDHLWKENLALWKELEQEHLTYKRELELHQTNQRRNNRMIKDLQQQISFLETEMSKRVMMLHDFTRP